MLEQLVKMVADRDGEAKGPSPDSMLEPVDAHLKNFDTHVEPALES